MPPPEASAAAARHLRRHAVRTDGPFTLRSGRVSSWYLDARQTTFSGEGARLVGAAVWEVIEGDEVDAVILGIDVENERISLGIKQSSADPWVTIQQEHPVGSRIHGTVTSVTDFGVFVEVADGIEGLIHISQLSTERVEKPSALFAVGQKVEAEVIHIDPREHKMGLSVKALQRSEEREEMQAYMHGENQETRFSFEDILGEELRLDRDDADGEQPKS